MCKTFYHKPLVGWYQQHDDLLCPHHPTPGSVPSRIVWPRLPRGRQTLGPSWGPATHSRPVAQTFQPSSITPRLSALTGKTETYCSLLNEQHWDDVKSQSPRVWTHLLHNDHDSALGWYQDIRSHHGRALQQVRGKGSQLEGEHLWVAKS